MDHQQEINKLKKQLFWTYVLYVLDVFGYILLGLWLYVKFVAEGHPFHPIVVVD